MEYFSNDIDKVQKIFEVTGVKVEYNTENYDWDITVNAG